MDDSRTDEQLVTAHLGGERQALAGIYDRYADALHDTAAAMLRDRHEAADATQEVFLIAAERLDQLRDPSRLKPWLFAILRNEVYRRTKRRSRDRPTDFSAPGTLEMAAPTDPGAEGEAVAYAELAESLRSAAAGLDPRDQLVLELSVRQGLAGTDLAGALGVTADQSYILVHRMRARVERSLGALAVARAGRKDCPELERVLAGWDGTFNVLVRKRVARHVDSCDICGETKRRYAALSLLAAAPAMAAPPELREMVLGRASGNRAVDRPYQFTADGGFPTLARVARRAAAALVIAVAATVVLLVAGVGTVLSWGSGGGGTAASDGTTTTEPVPSLEAMVAPSSEAAAPTTMTTTTTTTSTTTTATTAPGTTATAPTTTVIPTTPPVASTTTAPPVIETTTTQAPPPPPPPPAPGRLTLSSSVVDLGATEGSATLTLTNTGGSAVAWTLDDGAGPAPFTWSSGPTSLGPGQSSAIQFAIDRSGLPEGAFGRVFTITTDGNGGGPVDVLARVERAPSVRISSAPRSLSCPWSVPPFIGASVADESALPSVVLGWSGPGSPASNPMRHGASEWSGRLDIEQVDGTWTYIVTATDERGNVGRDTGSIVVTGC